MDQNRNEKVEDNLKVNAGEFAIFVFEVGQGDSQLIVFPSGYTIFIDASEANWNTGKTAQSVADKVFRILGRRNIDVGVVTHLHLDHMGYRNYGGFWALVEKHGFSFGKLIDRDAGRWVDRNNDGVCDPDTGKHTLKLLK